MTVGSSFTCAGGLLDELTLIACLVTDKKFRKIGGAQGLLQAAADKEAKNILVRQVKPEDLFHPDLSITERLLKLLFPQQLDAFKRVNLKIVHKFNDFSEREAVEDMDKLESWLLSVHDTIYDGVRISVFDPLQCIRIFYDRACSGRFIQNFCKNDGFESLAFWPEFWTAGEAGSFDFPVIVKPVDACSKADSHWMTLIKDPKANELLLSEYSNNKEYLIQRFHPHAGVFYKVYVVGRSVNIVPRPSISNFGPSGVFKFNTATFKAANHDLDEVGLTEAYNRFEPFRSDIERFSVLLAKKLNCSYFGVDIIIPENESRFAIIDINYLPGFDGVQDLSKKFIAAILHR